MEKSEALEILERAYFSEHPDEEAVLRLLPRYLADCSHFADIGASLGQFTLHAARIMRNGRIDAFEADPMRADRLKDNCQKWAEGSGNTITAHHLAVAKNGGAISFYSTESNVSGGLFPNSLGHLEENVRTKVIWTRMEVPAVCLDEFFSSATPQFVKMDIEGAEGDALQGARRLLGQRRTDWLIELHDFEGGWKASQVLDFMHSQRYLAEAVAPARYLFRPATVVGFARRKVASAWRRAKRKLKP